MRFIILNKVYLQIIENRLIIAWKSYKSQLKLVQFLIKLCGNNLFGYKRNFYLAFIVWDTDLIPALLNSPRWSVVYKQFKWQQFINR